MSLVLFLSMMEEDVESKTTPEDSSCGVLFEELKEDGCTFAFDP